jgi:hypothetical protein
MIKVGIGPRTELDGQKAIYYQKDELDSLDPGSSTANVTTMLGFRFDGAEGSGFEPSHLFGHKFFGLARVCQFSLNPHATVTITDSEYNLGCS